MPIPEDFDIDEKGNILFTPVVGFDILAPGNVAVAVRFKIVRSEEDAAARRFSNVQLILSASQAAALAEDLLRTLDRIHRAQTGETPQ